MCGKALKNKFHTIWSGIVSQVKQKMQWRRWEKNFLHHVLYPYIIFD